MNKHKAVKVLKRRSPQLNHCGFRVLSKLLERMVSKQLVAYLLEMICSQISSQLIGLITRRRLLFSTWNLKVLSDILLALDSGKLALLSLLDLSAAFSVDHDTLLLSGLRRPGRYR